MPIPREKGHENETEEEFVSRGMSHPDLKDKTKEQKLGYLYGVWREHHKSSKNERTGFRVRLARIVQDMVAPLRLARSLDPQMQQLHNSVWNTGQSHGSKIRRAVNAEAGDLRPHLAFADHLESQGKPAFASLIRRIQSPFGQSPSTTAVLSHETRPAVRPGWRMEAFASQMPGNQHLIRVVHESPVHDLPKNPRLAAIYPQGMAHNLSYEFQTPDTAHFAQMAHDLRSEFPVSQNESQQIDSEIAKAQAGPGTVPPRTLQNDIPTRKMPAYVPNPDNVLTRQLARSGTVIRMAYNDEGIIRKPPLLPYQIAENRRLLDSLKHAKDVLEADERKDERLREHLQGLLDESEKLMEELRPIPASTQAKIETLTREIGRLERLGRQEQPMRLAKTARCVRLSATIRAMLGREPIRLAVTMQEPITNYDVESILQHSLAEMKKYPKRSNQFHQYDVLATYAHQILNGEVGKPKYLSKEMQRYLTYTHDPFLHNFVKRDWEGTHVGRNETDEPRPTWPTQPEEPTTSEEPFENLMNTPEMFGGGELAEAKPKKTVYSPDMPQTKKVYKPITGTMMSDPEMFGGAFSTAKEAPQFEPDKYRVRRRILQGTTLGHHLRMLAKTNPNSTLGVLAHRALEGKHSIIERNLKTGTAKKIGIFELLGRELKRTGHHLKNAYNWHKVDNGLKLDAEVQKVINSSVPKHKEYQEALRQAASNAVNGKTLTGKPIPEDHVRFLRKVAAKVGEHLDPNNVGEAADHAEIGRSILRHLWRQEDRKEGKKASLNPEGNWDTTFGKLPGWAGPSKGMPAYSSPERYQRIGDLIRMALPNGLRELPFSGGLIHKAKTTPGLESQHGEQGQPLYSSPQPIAHNRPIYGKGPFAGTPDERRPFDGVTVRANPEDEFGSSHAFVESHAAKKAGLAAGLPLDHPVVGQEATHRLKEAMGNFLRENPNTNVAKAYHSASQPKHIFLPGLDAASHDLAEIAIDRHPWLNVYKELADKHDQEFAAKTKPMSIMASDHPDVSWENHDDDADYKWKSDELPESLEGGHPESEPDMEAHTHPVIQPAQELPPLPLANLPGELRGPNSRRNHLRKMVEEHGYGPEAAVQSLMREWAVPEGIAREAYRRASKQHGWEPLGKKARTRARLERESSPIRLTNPPAQTNSLATALSQLNAFNQGNYTKIMKSVLDRAGLNPHNIFPVLQDSIASIRNGVGASVEKPVSPDIARYATAWHGMLTKQPAVLSFMSSPDGPDSIYHLRASGSGDDVKAALDQAGVGPRLMIPQQGGFHVIVHDPGRQQRSAVANFSRSTGVPVQENRGTGEVIGGNDEESGRAAYRKVIRGSQGEVEKMDRGREVIRMAETFHKPENYDKIRDLPNGDQLWAGANDWECGWTWAWIQKPEVERDSLVKPEKYIEIDHSKCPGCHGDPDTVKQSTQRFCIDFGKKQVAKWVEEETGKKFRLERNLRRVRLATIFKEGLGGRLCRS